MACISFISSGVFPLVLKSCLYVPDRVWGVKVAHISSSQLNDSLAGHIILVQMQYGDICIAVDEKSMCIEISDLFSC